MKTTRSRYIRGTAALLGTTLAMCAVLAAPLAGASEGASEETVEYEWSVELDCTLCHELQTRTAYGAVEQVLAMRGEPAEDAPVKDEAAEQEDATNEDGAVQADEAPAEAESSMSAESADEEKEEAAELAEIDLYAAVHVADLKFTCVSCHPDTPELEEGHAKLNSGKTAKRLKKTDVESELCLACHQQEALADATSDSTVLTDSKGTVVNPHDYPQNESHDDLVCVDCHQAHAEGETLVALAQQTCLGCHHSDVYECGTCH